MLEIRAGNLMDPVKILIVDDHRAVRTGIRSLLSHRPEWTVCGEADNGVEAVDKAKTLHPHVVLMDVSMPRMNGLDATRRIRREASDCQVLILSQNDARAMERAAEQAGADGFVHKSKISRDLLPTIQSLLDEPGRKVPEISQERPDFQRKLQLQAEMLAAIVASSDDAIISKDLNGVITTWNKGAENIFGYTAEEAIGQNIVLIIPPDRREEETEILARLRRGEKVDHFETVRMRKDGTTFDISVTISPLKDFNGSVIGASKVGRDISSQKKIAAEAAAATAKFQAVFEQTTQFAGIMDKDGIFLQTNKLFLEACGYRAEEVLGRPFWDTPWWSNFPESQSKIRSATPLAAQGIPFRETLKYSLADGTERLVDFALFPILDNEGRVLFLHPTGVDITDIKRAEENSRKLAETLEAEVRARTIEPENRNAEVLKQSELLREFSQRLLRTQDEERRHIARELHDSAGQTLTVLGMGISQIIEKAARVAPELATDAEQVQDLVQQLHREIRTTSYLLHPPLLDESGLFSALSWYVDGLIERSGLEISLVISEDLGRLPRDMELVVFRLVQESLTNIHRHSGSKTAYIRIGRQGDTIRVEIQDEGKGISPGRMAEIQSRGSGVGIRGMRERLNQIHGTMTIQSSPSGTRISVTIPVPKDSREELGGAESLPTAV